jgi:hypothetical protein
LANIERLQLAGQAGLALGSLAGDNLILESSTLELPNGERFVYEVI